MTARNFTKMQRPIKVMLVGCLYNSLIEDIQRSQNIDICGFSLTGEQAISTYSHSTPDVILIDTVLPGITGIETARWIREQDRRIRIILLAHHFSSEFLIACAELQLDGYMLKTNSEDLLINAISKLQEELP